MELKEMSVPAEATSMTTAVFKPVTVIANTVSKEFLKGLELTEYCKVIEADLKEYENTVRALLSSKIETSRVKTDYEIRNQINATNSDSLLHAKNELCKYKCELKSSYVAAETSSKAKKLKYEKIISSYDSNWQNALKKLNANPVVLELESIKEENSLLEGKIEKQQRLNIHNEKQFVELMESIQTQFLKKVIEFSKAMTQYKKFLELQKQNKKTTPTKTDKNYNRNFGLKLFEEKPPAGKNSPHSESLEDPNESSTIDVSMFDDVIIPSENLESQSLEEDVYPTSQNKEQSSDSSKDHEEDLDRFNNKREHVEDKMNKISEEKEKRWNSMGRTAAEDENESHYFRLAECSKKSKIVEDDHQKSKTATSELDVSRKAEDNEEDVQKERGMEGEESLSGGSSENQFGIQNDTYGYQFTKATSFSSDEFPSSENVDGGDMRQKSDEEDCTNLFKLGQSEKRDFEPMSGFFTFANEPSSSKPEIFKLF